MITLMYHDVVAPESHGQSGFPGPGAARYKLTPPAFNAHLRAIATSCCRHPTLLGAVEPPGYRALLLTFDDGGISAHGEIAPALEAMGWRGHFFVTADRIGTPSFLSADQIRDLRTRGHLIGVHSWSHPDRMSHCPYSELINEWRRSVEVLSEILSQRVELASVPGGYYSLPVAQAAAEAGITTLFTSEPTLHQARVNGCLVLGRYTIFRQTPAETAACLATGRLLPRLKQAAGWQAKKLAKAAGGKYYLYLREALLKSMDAPR